MDKLPALFGPYKIGMRNRLPHFLLSAIAVRIKKGIVSGAALRQSHVRILRIEHILPALVVLDMQGAQRAVQLLRRNPQLLRHLGRSEAGNGIQDIIRVDRLRHQPIHLLLQVDNILALDGSPSRLLIQHSVETSDFHILLADEFLVKPQLHLLLMQQLLLLFQQFLLLLQGSPENFLGIANRLLLALPLLYLLPLHSETSLNELVNGC